MQPLTIAEKVDAVTCCKPVFHERPSRKLKMTRLQIFFAAKSIKENPSHL